MVGANDPFIAAQARALGLTLVTNNTGEFIGVRDLQWRTGRYRPVGGRVDRAIEWSNATAAHFL